MIASLAISDSKFNSIALVVIAIIGLIPIFYARSAKKNSEAAKQNSHETRVSMQEVADEVKTNGGMSDPNPNLNDHVKYQTEMLESLGKTFRIFGDTLVDVDGRLTDHLEHSSSMDSKLAEVYEFVQEAKRTG